MDAASPINVEGGDAVRGKRVLVIEDGPTLTHGEMKFGAGVVAAHKYGAAEIVDPRAYAVGTIKDTFSRYPDMGPILPAMGYGPAQIKDLQKTIANTECDLVVIATPVDLGSIIEIKRPSVRVSYELQELGTPTLRDILIEWLKKKE